MARINKNWYRLSFEEFSRLVGKEMGIEFPDNGLLLPLNITPEYLDVIRSYNARWEIDHGKLMDYNVRARECEKKGEYSKAISLYETYIFEGENDCRFPVQTYLQAFERLAIIYRKLKEPEKEIEVLNRALKHREKLHPDQERWLADRLEKISKKIAVSAIKD